MKNCVLKKYDFIRELSIERVKFVGIWTRAKNFSKLNLKINKNNRNTRKLFKTTLKAY